MLKKTVSYTDYNDEQATDTLYFNLNKTEAADLVDLIPELQELQIKLKTVGTNPTEAQQAALMREILQLVKLLVEKSYGERSDDGKRFIKSPEIYRDFTQTAVYDAFLFGLFEQEAVGAIEFITAILPKEFREQGTVAASLPDDSQLPSYPVAELDDRPVWVREGRDPSTEEIRNMTKEELKEEFLRKFDGN